MKRFLAVFLSTSLIASSVPAIDHRPSQAVTHSSQIIWTHQALSIHGVFLRPLVPFVLRLVSFSRTEIELPGPLARFIKVGPLYSSSDRHRLHSLLVLGIAGFIGGVAWWSRVPSGEPLFLPSAQLQGAGLGSLAPFGFLTSFLLLMPVAVWGATLLLPGGDDDGQDPKISVSPGDRVYQAQSLWRIKRAIGLPPGIEWERFHDVAGKLPISEIQLLGDPSYSKYLLNLVRQPPERRVLIYGVGEGDDLPLIELWLSCREVVWTDVSVEGMRGAYEKAHELIEMLWSSSKAVDESVLKRVRLQGVDLGGIGGEIRRFQAVIENSTEAGAAAKGIEGLIDELLKRPFQPTALSGHYDVIISNLVSGQLAGMSQIENQFFEKFGQVGFESLARLQPKLRALVSDIQHRHLRDSARMLEKGGILYWADTVEAVVRDSRGEHRFQQFDVDAFFKNAAKYFEADVQRDVWTWELGDANGGTTGLPASAPGIHSFKVESALFRAPMDSPWSEESEEKKNSSFDGGVDGKGVWLPAGLLLVDQSGIVLAAATEFCEAFRSWFMKVNPAFLLKILKWLLVSGAPLAVILGSDFLLPRASAELLFTAIDSGSSIPSSRAMDPMGAILCLFSLVPIVGGFLLFHLNNKRNPTEEEKVLSSESEAVGMFFVLIGILGFGVGVMWMMHPYLSSIDVSLLSAAAIIFALTFTLSAGRYLISTRDTDFHENPWNFYALVAAAISLFGFIGCLVGMYVWPAIESLFGVNSLALFPGGRLVMEAQWRRHGMAGAA